MASMRHGFGNRSRKVANPINPSTLSRTKGELISWGLWMIRLHSTRLMRCGEITLWHRGVWQGSVGAYISGVTFDAVSLSTDDGARMTSLIGGRPATADVVESTLANWWAKRSFHISAKAKASGNDKPAPRLAKPRS
jgi:hypothetical protein